MNLLLRVLAAAEERLHAAFDHYFGPKTPAQLVDWVTDRLDMVAPKSFVVDSNYRACGSEQINVAIIEDIVPGTRSTAVRINMADLDSTKAGLGGLLKIFKEKAYGGSVPEGYIQDVLGHVESVIADFQPKPAP